MKIHARRSIGVEVTALAKGSLKGLEERRNVDAMLQPGANYVVPGDTRHVKIPNVDKTVKKAAGESVFAAKTKAIKIRQSTAGQDIQRSRKRREIRWRSWETIQIQPLHFLIDAKRSRRERIEIRNSVSAAIPAPHVNREILDAKEKERKCRETEKHHSAKTGSPDA